MTLGTRGKKASRPSACLSTFNSVSCRCTQRDGRSGLPFLFGVGCVLYCLDWFGCLLLGSVEEELEDGGGCRWFIFDADGQDIRIVGVGDFDCSHFKAPLAGSGARNLHLDWGNAGLGLLVKRAVGFVDFDVEESGGLLVI